ncbi:peptidylprolyl isomerase [Gloeocapsa sp. BRSZ]|uniref:peptidylprolyl isomerase n=1 Tax=Gloeocapsa sp. PCC 7428 TaxID=1173026 RepID=UPI0002A5D9D0|nr:peptidylprolyl isomerase [Gloeocapsa sp. PCC 7428]AFZ30753.1 peptidyl-prolyl cis-trans isomerase cyclophilin type [Gloeocapsa sp. PCC 7428]
MHRKIQLLFAVLLIGGLMLGGCTPDQASVSSPTSPATQTTSPTTPTTQTSSPQMKSPVLEGTATVVMTVNGSPITIEVDGTNAPVTAGNFVDLVQRGVYDGLVFHRVVRQPEPFVVQGGDPQSRNPNFPPQRLGTGGFVDPNTGSERFIPLEIKPQGAAEPVYSQTLEKAGISTPPQLRHTRGAVAMARSQQPDSASSQFYFALADLAFLDGSYAVFGYVTDGMDVVDQIQQGDRIESAQVTQGAENLRGGQ